MVLSDREGRGRLGSVCALSGAASRTSSLAFVPVSKSSIGLTSVELARAVDPVSALANVGTIVFFWACIEGLFLLGVCLIGS